MTDRNNDARLLGDLLGRANHILKTLEAGVESKAMEMALDLEEYLCNFREWVVCKLDPSEYPADPGFLLETQCLACEIIDEIGCGNREGSVSAARALESDLESAMASGGSR